MAKAKAKKTYSVEELKKIIKEQGSSEEQFFGYPVKEDGLYLQQDPQEFADLVHFLNAEVGSVDTMLDLGIASGGQTKFIRDYLDVKKTIILDDGQHEMFHHWARIKKEVKSEIVCEIIDDSHAPSVREKLKPWYGTVDIAYVDGDHSYKGLKQDIFLMKYLLKEGGYMILHDTTAVWDCRKVYDELCKSGEFHLFRNFENRFGISVWIRRGRHRTPKWYNHAYGWGRI